MSTLAVAEDRRTSYPADGQCVEPECRVLLRRSQERVSARPGTRVHAGNGLCYTCWRKARKAAAAIPAHTAALRSYLTRRRQRSTAPYFNQEGSR